MHLTNCDQSLDGLVREREMNLVFQIHAAPIYTHVCFTHKTVQITFNLNSIYTKMIFLNIMANETDAIACIFIISYETGVVTCIFYMFWQQTLDSSISYSDMTMMFSVIIMYGYVCMVMDSFAKIEVVV